MVGVIGMIGMPGAIVGPGRLMAETTPPIAVPTTDATHLTRRTTTSQGTTGIQDAKACCGVITDTAGNNYANGHITSFRAVSNEAMTPMRTILHRDGTCPILIMILTTNFLLTSDNGSASLKIEDDALFVLILEP